MHLLKIHFLLIGLGIVFTQDPFPLPSLNLENIQGQWAIIWETGLNSQMNTSKCYRLNILTGVDSGILEFEVSQDEVVNPDDLKTITGISTSNSTWKIDSESYNWVAIDPISYSWGVLTWASNAIIISRTSALSQTISQAAILLLTREGFVINSTNSQYLNQNCPAVFNPVPIPIDPNGVGGLWYFNWVMMCSGGFGGCVTMEASNDVLSLTAYSGRTHVTASYPITLTVQDGVWLVHAQFINPFIWVAADLVEYSWGVIVLQNSPIFLTRTNVLNTTLVNQTLAFLETQGFNSSSCVMINFNCSDY